jgi:hypothetical protein
MTACRHRAKSDKPSVARKLGERAGQQVLRRLHGCRPNRWQDSNVSRYERPGSDAAFQLPWKPGLTSDLRNHMSTKRVHHVHSCLRVLTSGQTPVLQSPFGPWPMPILVGSTTRRRRRSTCSVGVPMALHLTRIRYPYVCPTGDWGGPVQRWSKQHPRSCSAPRRSAGCTAYGKAETRSHIGIANAAWMVTVDRNL